MWHEQARQAALAQDSITPTFIFVFAETMEISIHSQVLIIPNEKSDKKGFGTQRK